MVSKCHGLFGKITLRNEAAVQSFDPAQIAAVGVKRIEQFVSQIITEKIYTG